MEADDLARLLLFGAWFLWRVVSHVRNAIRGRQERPDAGGPKSQPARHPGADPQPAEDAPATALLGVARRLAQEVAALPPSIQPTLARPLRATIDQLETLDPSAGREVLQGIAATLAIQKKLIRQRARPSDLAILGDADALAAACYEPLCTFMADRGNALRSSQPLCFFDERSQPVQFWFRSSAVAPIALPRAYATELWRWPAIAHEIAHDFYASVDGLEEEVTAAAVGGRFLDSGGPIQPNTPEFTAVLLATWTEELFADVFGTLMIGPTYLRTMAHIFAEPKAPERVVTFGLDAAGGLESHPPRHLRVHWTTHVLSRMGFGGDARALARRWDEEHGHPETLWLAAAGTQLEIDLDTTARECQVTVDHVYDEEFAVLYGHRLSDVPGLEFSHVQARRATQARSRLAQGIPAAFDARALIAGAAEASLDHPDRAVQVAEAARASIVGVGTGERIATVRAAAQTPVPGRPRPQLDLLRQPLTAARLVDALIIAETLEPPLSHTSPARYAPRMMRTPPAPADSQ